MDTGKINITDSSIRKIKSNIKDLISDKSTHKNFINELFEHLLEISDLKERINLEVLMVNIFF